MCRGQYLRCPQPDPGIQLLNVLAWVYVQGPVFTLSTNFTARLIVSEEYRRHFVGVAVVPDQFLVVVVADGVGRGGGDDDFGNWEGVHGCMVHTERTPGRHHFHVVPAM